MDHPTHRLNFYHDNHKRIVYCEKCSREDADLSTPCPGKFVPLSVNNSNQTVDTKPERN